MKRLNLFICVLLPVIAVAGCTSHPDGEQHERDLAARAGGKYAPRLEDRALPALSTTPTTDGLLKYAYLASPELEQKFWEWKAAIEQIPQDGTQATNLVLYGNVPITRGSTAFNRTVVTVANDPMADIQWPIKPMTAARRAIDEARAAGLRFQQAKFDLRQKVLTAEYEYALGNELLLLEQSNHQLLETTANTSEAANASGRISQNTVLTQRDDADLSQNQIDELRAKLVSLRATLNAAIGRDPAEALTPPSLQKIAIAKPDQENLMQLISSSPMLRSLQADEKAKNRAIELAKLQYLPDFSLSASTDLGGVVQNLMGMVTVPVLRYEAIDGAIRQAEAHVRAADAERRQASIDLNSRVISDVTSFEDIQRQLGLLENRIVPRAESAAILAQQEFETNHRSLADLLDAQRSVIALKRLDANLNVAGNERLVDIETTTGTLIP